MKLSGNVKSIFNYEPYGVELQPLSDRIFCIGVNRKGIRGRGGGGKDSGVQAVKETRRREGCLSGKAGQEDPAT